MKEKGSVGAVVLVIFALLLVGLVVFWYVFFQSSQKQLEKARTPDSSLNTESKILVPKNEIKEGGYNSTIVLTPSQNDVISGEVTVKALDVPIEAKHVGFSINENFDDLGVGGPNLGFDSKKDDGWSIVLDTTKYNNGIYYVAFFVFSTDATSNPVAVANAQVEVKN